jgi:hypothetical protein
MSDLVDLGADDETPNNALERSVTGSARGAAGAPEMLALAAPGNCLARPAQRGR